MCVPCIVQCHAVSDPQLALEELGVCTALCRDTELQCVGSVLPHPSSSSVESDALTFSSDSTSGLTVRAVNLIQPTENQGNNYSLMSNQVFHWLDSSKNYLLPKN